MVETVDILFTIFGVVFFFMIISSWAWVPLLSSLYYAGDNKSISLFISICIIVIGGMGTTGYLGSDIKLKEKQQLFDIIEDANIKSIECRQVKDGGIIDTYHLNVVYGDDFTIEYDNPNFHCDVEIKTSDDGKYHIGTNKERLSDGSKITFFVPKDYEESAYISN